MAGLGRRSHYRKHLTDAVLNDLPEPDETMGQRIARVVGTRGGNMFDIVVAPMSVSSQESSSSMKEQSDKEESADKIILDLPPSLDDNANRTQLLAFLPTKFRKLVWIKRNDFIIVQCGEEESIEQSDQKDAGGSGFRYVITHILYKDQVKHIKSKGLWPDDPYFADEAAESEHNNKEQQSNVENVNDKVDVDGDDSNDNNNNESDSNYNEASYEDGDGIVFDDPLDDEYMINTNRVARLTVDDSSSDGDSD